MDNNVLKVIPNQWTDHTKPQYFCKLRTQVQVLHWTDLPLRRYSSCLEVLTANKLLGVANKAKWLKVWIGTPVLREAVWRACVHGVTYNMVNWMPWKAFFDKLCGSNRHSPSIASNWGAINDPLQSTTIQSTYPHTFTKCGTFISSRSKPIQTRLCSTAQPIKSTSKGT